MAIDKSRFNEVFMEIREYKTYSEEEILLGPVLMKKGRKSADRSAKKAQKKAEEKAAEENYEKIVPGDKKK